METSLSTLTFADCMAYKIDQFPLEHYFFSRQGGFSQAPFASLNIAYQSEDNNTLKNREKLFSLLNIDKAHIKQCCPSHEDNIAYLSTSSWSNEYPIKKTDAVFNTAPGKYLLLGTADCIPLLITTKSLSIAGLIHLGWRNVVDNLVEKALKGLFTTYDLRATELVLALGPAIYPCCYQFDDPTQKDSPFWQPYLKHIKANRYRINLPAAVIAQCRKVGVPASSIYESRLCTACENQSFFSCYKEGYQSGRFATLVGMPAIPVK